MNDKPEEWDVVLLKQPQKALRRMPKNLRERVRNTIWTLTETPFPQGYKKLINFNNHYRLRVGDWRIVYTVKNDQLLILVIRIAPRGAAYKNL